MSVIFVKFKLMNEIYKKKILNDFTHLKLQNYIVRKSKLLRIETALMLSFTNQHRKFECGSFC